jgi:hypothetical protein
MIILSFLNNYENIPKFSIPSKLNSRPKFILLRKKYESLYLIIAPLNLVSMVTLSLKFEWKSYDQIWLSVYNKHKTCFVSRNENICKSINTHIYCNFDFVNCVIYNNLQCLMPQCHFFQRWTTWMTSTRSMRNLFNFNWNTHAYITMTMKLGFFKVALPSYKCNYKHEIV